MPARDTYRLPPIVGEGVDAETRWQGDMTRRHGEPYRPDPVLPPNWGKVSDELGGHEQRDPCLQTLHEQNEALRAKLQFEEAQLRARGQMAYDNGLDAGRKQGSARERRRIAMPLMLIALATALLCWGLWHHGYAQGKAHEQQTTATTRRSE